MSAGGRKYKKDEAKITRLGELCVEWAIGRMQSDKTSESIKKDIALKVLSRWIPQQTDITSGGEKIVVLPSELTQKYAVNTSTKPDSEGQAQVSGS